MILTAREVRAGDTALTLAAATPLVTQLKLAHAERYRLTIHNTGANPITALRVRYYALEGDTAGPWESITTDIPLAAGARWTMLEDGQCAYALDVELTSTGGTTVALYLGGV